MLRKILITAVAALYMLSCHGQTDSLYQTRSWFHTQTPDYYIGVQVNQLLKEIINLNTSTGNNTNPYLLIASVYMPKCKWGVQVGLGYNYQDITDQLNPANHESKINDFSYRAGIGKRIMMSKRFEAGFGIDYVGELDNNVTFSNSVTNLGNETDSAVSVSTSKTTTSGLGLQFTFGYHITEKIIVSTEATAYYTTSEEKSNIILTDYITSSIGGQSETTLSSSNSYTKVKNFTFTLPVAIFLSVKF